MGDKGLVELKMVDTAVQEGLQVNTSEFYSVISGSMLLRELSSLGNHL